MQGNPPQTAPISLIRIALKTAALFLLVNLLFAWIHPMEWLGNITLYNVALPGRTRLPYGEHPNEAYNFSLDNFDAMFASHVIHRQKPADEFRVAVIGDSSVWGYLLHNEETLTAHLQDCGLVDQKDKHVIFYNLGYPTMSVLKDAILLRYALREKPDLVIWLTTLESMPWEKQLASPILQHNQALVAETLPQLADKLGVNAQTPLWSALWERSIVGERRNLADLIRLQLYGIDWASTQIDQYYPANYEPPVRDLPEDETFHGMLPPTIDQRSLAWEILDSGIAMAGKTPILFVNEPIYISDGIHSDLRYNAFYPRWAYDQFRFDFMARAALKGWFYLDAWNLVPSAEYTNSAIHFSSTGEARLADQICTALRKNGSVR